MGSAMEMRTDLQAVELRRLAKSSRNTKRSHRLLSPIAGLAPRFQAMTRRASLGIAAHLKCVSGCRSALPRGQIICQQLFFHGL